MEQFRLFMAITLSVLVFVVWNLFFMEKPEVPVKKPVVEKKAAKKGAKETKVAPVKKTAAAKPKVVKKQVVVNRTEKFYTVETPLYIVKLSSKGANIRSFKLKKFKEDNNKAVLKELVNFKETLNISFKHNSVQGLDTTYYTSNSISSVKVANSDKDIVFSYTDPNGVVVNKIFTFDSSSYLIKCRVNVRNNSSAPVNDTVRISLVNGKPESRLSFVGSSVYKGGSVEEFVLDADDLKEKNSVTGNIDWVAFQDRYFLSSVLPSGKNAESVFRVELKDKISITSLEKKLAVVHPGKDASYSFKVFMGPIQTEALDQAGSDLSKALDFGWFTFIGKPCLVAMKWIYKYIPNYGLAIIILTLFIKLVLWPLGNKGYKSMNEMKKLQPLMTEIREKYKDDKKKMNEEVMNLYRTYKINPLGGCLPMIAQIPIFFALYRMLYQAIELRHAPFFGWITDLSAPDRLFDFGFSIPFMDPPYGIPVLTILMGASMFLQQKMTPQAGDATQARIMMLMPLFMTVIFINFSSGLVLYWFVNNIFSIAQQYYTMKKKVK